jgi:hypothetical protein
MSGLPQTGSLVPQKIHLKSATCGAAEIFFQIPLVPLFQRGISSAEFETPLWKRGEGEIFGAMVWQTFAANFWVSTLDKIASNQRQATNP